MFRILFTATAVFLMLLCFLHEGSGHDDSISVASNETYTLASHSGTGDHSHTYSITVWSPLVPDGDSVPVAWDTRTVHYTDSSHSHDKDGHTDTHSHLRRVGDHSHSDFPAKTPENEGESTPAGWVDSEHTHTSTHSRIPEGLRVTTTHSHPHDPNGHHTHPGETVADIRAKTEAQTDYWHSHDGYVRHSHPGSSRDSHGGLDHSNLLKTDSSPPPSSDLTGDDEGDDSHYLIGPHSHDGLISHTHLLPIGRSHDDVSHVHTPKIGEEVEAERSADTRQPVNTQPVNTQPVNTQPVNTQPVGTQPVGTTTPPVTETPTNNNRQPADPALEQPVGGVNTPPVVVVPTPNTGDAGEPPVQEQAPQVVEVVHPTFPLRILSVEEKQDPRRLVVTIKNDGRQFYRLDRPFSIELLQRSGRPVVVANMRHSVGPLYLLGREKETVFALLPKSLFGEVDANEVNFMVHFQYFYGNQKGFLEGDRIALKYDGRVVSEYPEPLPDDLVPAFPLTITSVEEKQDPRRLLVTIRNRGRQTHSLQHPLRFEMLQHDGETVVYASMRKNRGSVYLRGGAETVVALLPKHFFDAVDTSEVSLMVHFQYIYGNKKGYLDGDRIALKYGDEVISEYPDPALAEPVPAFPLQITSVEEKKSPRRLLVTIKNTGRPDHKLERPFSLELLQHDGETVVVANLRRGLRAIHLRGGAEITLALLPENLFGEMDASEVNSVVPFQYFQGKQQGYLDSDRIALKHGGEIISEYPEPPPGEPALSFPLQITSVEKKKSPRRLLVTIKNSGRPTYELQHPFSLELQRNGETVVIADWEHTAGSGQLVGLRETVFTLLPKRLFRKVDISEVSFLIHFQYFYGDQKGYLDGDRLVLKYDNEVISEYPDPEQADSEQVAAAPSLQVRRKTTSMWGSLKME